MGIMSWIKHKSSANTRTAKARNNRQASMRGNYGKMSKNNRRKRFGNLKNTTSRKNPRPLGPPPSSAPPPPPGAGATKKPKHCSSAYAAKFNPACKGGGRRRKRRTRRRKKK